MIDFQSEKEDALLHLMDALEEVTTEIKWSPDTEDGLNVLVKAESMNKLKIAYHTFGHFEYALGQDEKFPLSPDEHTFENVKRVFEQDQCSPDPNPCP